MRAFVFLVILWMAAISCNEDGAPGGCAEPGQALEQIASLSNIVTKGQVAGRPTCIVYSGAQIFACLYKRDRVYYFTNPASSMSTCGFIAYDCPGDEIFNRGVGAAEWDAFISERTEEEELWKKD